MELPKLRRPNYTPLIILMTINIISFVCKCQFISHINSKGLRGNISFEITNEANDNSFLVIESILEPTRSIWSSKNKKDDEEFDTSLPIQFDWSIHANTLEPQMLSACSTDDLGPSVSDSLFKASLPNQRKIVLSKFNQWMIPLKEFLDSNSATNLSPLIWGKSIRFSLSQVHLDAIQKEQKLSGQKASPLSPGLSKPNVNITQKPAINKPSIPGGGKPTFAPRVRPQVSAKFNKTPVPAALPKPLALIWDSEISSAASSLETSSTSTTTTTTSTTTTSTTTPDPLQIIQEATHKRIARAYGRTVVCGNIIDTRNVKTAEAIFESQSVAGKVTIRGNEDDTSLIMVSLYQVRSKVTTRHDWKIMASDILDTRRQEERCKYLQVLFDPNNTDDTNCKKGSTTKCKIGDLTRKHGQVQVAGQGKNTRSTLVDLNLPLSALEGSRSLYLVLYEVAIKSSSNGLPQKANILSCAQIKSVSQRKLEANFNMDGVRGTFKMTQRHPTEPTQISYDLFGLEGNTKHQTIRELPLSMRTSSDNSKLCNSLGDVYNPHKVIDSTSEEVSTIDAYRVGNLSAKHGQLLVIDSEYEDHYMGEYIDLSIQLYGPHNVVGRSIVIHKNNGDSWACATLGYIQESVTVAMARFFYPVVGQISFQQLEGDQFAETNVLVEVYNPNSQKNSEGHNWMIHLKPAMADSYNWSQRCESSGEVYDPIQASIGLNNDVYTRQCQASMLSEPLRCRAGDTSLKSGFKLSLPVTYLNRSRYYYTDLFLPLTGANSIIGKSVVLYDENAPTQRGNRLACSNIKVVHPLKAAIKSWDSGPSIPSSIRGSIVFEQESSTKATKVKIDLGGFNGNVENYAIHQVWTIDDREFPCSNDSLYDIYDPYDNEHSSRLPPSAHYGALATVDRVKVGDMSRKHGTFEGLQSIQKSYVDANLPLFAPQSIIGRSMVLRAAVNDFRWVCGNIELDYDKGDAREIVAMASFDEPRSKVSGYVRFVQLEHKDGSLSDTYIQADLRMQSDGIHELQTSQGHNWAIFVNQVGEDAFIAADEVRCIASGFKWNPYLAQDTLESYSTACSVTEHQACAMGDLGMRHGSLTLGPNNRRTLSDSNLPLVGNYSVMGRSLVIFDNKRSNVKLACANLFSDIHLKSNVVIKRTPSFTVARFVEQMRSLLGAADWLMVPELRATKPVANGECVQMTIHFYGQKAHQMQVELNNLITLGTVRKTTRIGHGEKISTHYKLCRAGQKELISSAMLNLNISNHLLAAILGLNHLLTSQVLKALYNR